MSTSILNPSLQAARDRVEELVKDLHNLSVEVGHEPLQQTLSDLRNRLRDPFMFVIVGEVKAGKSSFINALLDTGREIAPAAPQPLTDTIQQITYGDTEQVIKVNPFLKKVLLPVEILREIAIVDTPGTNTIVEQHQQITEGFIPSSDLVVFVFEAKNPYRQSAWDFFRFIHTDWRKKILFVFQQKDLMNEADLAVNESGVRSQAEKLGMEAPLVFSVSAKQELERDLRLELEHKINSSVHDLAESIQQMARVMHLKIQQTDSKRLPREALFTDIAERRSQVLRELQSTFAEFTQKEENFKASELFPGPHSLAPNLVAGGSVAILGAVLTALTNLSVFDITGGILTAVGLLFAGVSTGLKRNSLVRSYRDEVEKGQQRLERELSARLKDYVQLIRQRLHQQFADFDALLETEASQIEQLHTKVEAMAERVSVV